MADVDVLVVGGGPSGLTVAAEVARTGAFVRVLEKRSVEPFPRAGTLLPRPLELFDARGVAGRFIQRTAEMSPHPFQTWHIWGGMHPVDWTARDSRFGFTLFLSQHESEFVLREWATESGVDLRFRSKVVGLVDRGEYVEVTMEDSDGATSVVTAQYVIGADGGRSTVRQLAGIDFPGHDTTFTGVIVTAEMDFPWPGGLKVAHNERGWINSFPFGPGLTRFTMVHAGSRHLPQDEPVTVEEMSRCVSEIFEERVTIPSLRAATRYGDTTRLASQFRKGRVILVGESMRLHYPASGVGMNFCIQDAFNLGWKLGAVLAGFAPPALLDTYEQERRPIVNDLFRSVDAQVAVQFNFTKQGLTFIRNFEEHFIRTPDVVAQLWRELNGLETPYPAVGSDHPCVGLPAPDFEIFLRDGSSTRLYELLHDGQFVVLDIGGRGALRGLELPKVPVKSIEGHPVRLPAQLRDVTTLVVRPDTYVSWATTDTRPSEDAIRAEVARWLSEPTFATESVRSSATVAVRAHQGITPSS